MPVSRTRKKKKSSSPPLKMLSKENTPEKRDGSKLPAATFKKTTLYQGAIPPPEMMEHYALIDTSFPNRLLKAAEDEGSHRREKELSIIQKAYILDWAGLISGILSVIGVGWLVYVFMINGHPTEGMGLGISIMVALAIVFVTRKAPPPKNPKE